MTSADTKAISKRQRRAQGSNPSTTWQQQPRIKSAASRARAYINYAGLNDDDNNENDGKKTKKGKAAKKVEEMLDPQLDLNSPEVKFGRMLGGTEQRVRHKAVKMLRHYLKQRADIATGAGISELDLMKLWKVSVLKKKSDHDYKELLIYRGIGLNLFDDYTIAGNVVHSLHG